MFGDKKTLEQTLEEQGATVAWATVLEARDRWGRASPSNAIGRNTMRMNPSEHWTVTLKVEPDGATPFDVTLKAVFKGMDPCNGWQCKVIYDQNDHAKIAIQDDKFYPPGRDRDIADRSAAMLDEVHTAMRSGHMAEYVEDMKANSSRGQLPGAAFGNTETIADRGSSQLDIADQLTKLADLRDRGVLTDAEFETQKAKLLAAS